VPADPLQTSDSVAVVGGDTPAVPSLSKKKTDRHAPFSERTTATQTYGPTIVTIFCEVNPRQACAGPAEERSGGIAGARGIFSLSPDLYVEDIAPFQRSENFLTTRRFGRSDSPVIGAQ
ncbi:MAG: hypothetical protein ACXVR1_15355, partial [Solirubrobacteraceae bacterium]